jgi:hypothetical protein
MPGSCGHGLFLAVGHPGAFRCFAGVPVTDIGEPYRFRGGDSLRWFGVGIQTDVYYNYSKQLFQTFVGHDGADISPAE